MKPFHRKYKNLIELALVSSLAIVLGMLGLPVIGVVAVIACYQLYAFARSPRAGLCYAGALTPEQIKEFESILNEFKTFGGDLKELSSAIKSGDWAKMKGLHDQLGS